LQLLQDPQDFVSTVPFGLFALQPHLSVASAAGAVRVVAGRPAGLGLLPQHLSAGTAKSGAATRVNARTSELVSILFMLFSFEKNR